MQQATRGLLQIFILMSDYFPGMTGLDKWDSLTMRAVELWELFKSPERINAKNILAQAKSVVSPYFGVNDFAFAYVRT